MERGYSAKLIRKKVLEARKFSRNELLDKVKIKRDPFLTFNITYHPAYAKIKNVLSKIHILLSPDEGHRKVFPQVPVIGFRNGKSLKNILVRAKVTSIKTEGSSTTCKGKRCNVCNYVKSVNSFSDKNNSNTYQIRSNDLNCNSKMVVYLVQCKQCKSQYVGSASTKFRFRFNNYKYNHRKFNLNQAVPQESFYNHFKTIRAWKIGSIF